MWLLLLLHAIFASTYTLGKSSLLYATPVFAVSIRLFFSAIVLFAFLLFQGKSFQIKRRDFLLFVSLSFFLFYSYIPDFMVLPYISSTKWALIYTLTPFFTALISYFHKSEHMSWMKVIGLCIGFVGMMPVLILDGDYNALGGLWRFSWPEIVMFFCMVSYSYGWVMAHKLIRQKKYDASLVNGVGMLIGGMAGLATSPLVESWSAGPISSFWPFCAIMVPLVLATTLAFTINTYLLKFYTVTFLMFLMFVDPLYVAFYGRVFLGEHVSGYFFVSVFMLFVGLYLFYKEEIKHCYIES